ncbi:MAG: hypothetical protein N0C84_00930 [Candidatus Thiodiazotropha taylori]|uniref:Gp5/Type VI secretion system Vgr C-terminal trimerisation domain-containing protein n=1 Tax=Candidatus Thiodiazotropha taylori TaxID=2792791 RepID=A0A9E4N3I6_9GAMM|nr:hypothetical protein [Candidatus Thiodiazotropha taylori]MCW4255009.1 hypothetical protein [Candidatus Thiodiazotropha taylori]
MSTRDLINLGVHPDSGTGDSARKGGEKINTLFSDIYANFGDYPIENNPASDHYGLIYSANPNQDLNYKVGELHATGYYIPVGFSETGGTSMSPDGFDNTTISGADGIPDIYKDSEIYFLSRGEMINADLTDIPEGSPAHFILPLASPGDQVKIMDGFGTWSKKHISIWTTPHEFQTQTQIDNWKEYYNVGGFDTTTNLTKVASIKILGNLEPVNCSFKKYDSPVDAQYSIEFNPDTVNGHTLSQSNFQPDSERLELWFTYIGPSDGWICKKVILETPDVDAILDQMSKSLQRGLRVYTTDVLSDGTTEDSDGNVNLYNAREGIRFTGPEDNIRIRLSDEVIQEDGTDYFNKVVTISLDSDVSVERNVTVGQDLTVLRNTTIEGDLHVKGTSTRIDTRILTALDPIVLLNSDQGQPVTENSDIGLILQRFATPNQSSGDMNIGIGWDEDDKYYKIGTTVTTGLQENNTEIVWSDEYVKMNDSEAVFQGNIEIPNGEFRLSNLAPNSVIYTDSEKNFSTHPEFTYNPVAQTFDLTTGEYTISATNETKNIGQDQTVTIGSDRTLEVTGDNSEDVTGTKTTVVHGDVTETYNSSQTTHVIQDQRTAVDGIMNETVLGDVTENYHSSQTTAVTGTRTETVTGNVTENYQSDQSTSVTQNQSNTVGGTLTETVTGNVTETYEEDQSTSVTQNQSNTVGGTLTETVTGNTTESYQANQESTVAGTRTETVTGDVTENYQSDQATSVTQNQSNTVGGTRTETVTGNVTENYQSDQATSVTQNQSNTVGGTLTETVTGNVTENYQANQESTVGGTRTETVTGNVTETYNANHTTDVEGNQTNDVNGTLTETVRLAVTENYQNTHSTNVTSNQSNTVGGTLTETVTGNVTENYQSDQATSVTQNQRNTVGGAMSETVTGVVTETYQNNQVTAVAGQRNETVTGNVTETYNANQTTTVDGNRTETVTGNTIENLGDNAADTHTKTVIGTQTESHTGNITRTTVGDIRDNITGTWTVNADMVVFGSSDNDSVQFTSEIDSHFIPNVDNSYDLGEPTKEWRNLYLDGEAHIDSLETDTAKVTDLTEDRIVIVGPGGELEDDENFTFDGTTFNIGKGGLTVDVASGDTLVKGDLTVNGTTTTINSTTLEVADKNILLAKDSATDAAADGAGITVDSPSGASITYNAATDKWVFNKKIVTPAPTDPDDATTKKYVDDLLDKTALDAEQNGENAKVILSFGDDGETDDTSTDEVIFIPLQETNNEGNNYRSLKFVVDAAADTITASVNEIDGGTF